MKLLPEGSNDLKVAPVLQVVAGVLFLIFTVQCH